MQVTADLQFDPVDQGLGVPSLHHLRDERTDFSAARSDNPQSGDPHRFIDRRVNLLVVRHPLSERGQGLPKAVGYLVGAGINYTATNYAVTVEALIPGNKQTGSHMGVIAQFHLYFDDLFPNSLGKPIVNWWQ